MTAQQVFNLAMSIIKKVNTDGTATAAATQSYGTQVPGIMTMLQTELLSAENSTSAPAIVSALTDNLLVTDRTAMLVMPYGLLAHLLISADPDKAAFYNDKYEEFKRKIPLTPVEITDYYSTIVEE